MDERRVREIVREELERLTAGQTVKMAEEIGDIILRNLRTTDQQPLERVES